MAGRTTSRTVRAVATVAVNTALNKKVPRHIAKTVSCS